MKNTILLFLILILPMSALAQELKSVTGKVIDAETKQPIEAVAIYTPSGNTISNAEGEYAIKCTEGDSMMFSHINYYSQTIQSLSINSPLELKPRTYELTEVVIIPEEALVKELKKVWNKYHALLKDKKEADYPRTSFYYRQLVFVDDACTEYIESFFTASKNVKIMGLALQEGRYAKIENKLFPTFTNFFVMSQVSSFSLEKGGRKDPVNPFLCADFDKYYKIKILRIISSGEEDEVKVYGFTPIDKNDKNTPSRSGSLYIRSKDHAIVRMEVDMKGIINSSIKNTTVQHDNNLITVIYRDVKGSYPVVESVQVKADFLFLHNSSKERTEVKISSTLFAVDISFVGKGNKLKLTDTLLREVAKSKYDQAFWDNNPVVKRTKVEQQVLDDLNREGYFGTMNLEK